MRVGEVLEDEVRKGLDCKLVGVLGNVSGVFF